MRSAAKTGLSRRAKNNISCYLMCGLPVLGFFIFALVPLVISLYLSFTEMSTLNFYSSTFK